MGDESGDQMKSYTGSGNSATAEGRERASYGNYINSRSTDVDGRFDMPSRGSRGSGPGSRGSGSYNLASFQDPRNSSGSRTSQTNLDNLPPASVAKPGSQIPPIDQIQDDRIDNEN